LSASPLDFSAHPSVVKILKNQQVILNVTVKFKNSYMLQFEKALEGTIDKNIGNKKND
jgi:hypothetical protein